MASRRRNSARQVRKELEEYVNRRIGRLAFRVWQALTFATPVDTGYARAGWTIATGTKRFAIRGNRPGDLAAARAQAAAVLGQNASQAARIQQSYRLNQGVVFITNAVSYVRFLNEGSSAQAPSMFVEQAIRQAVAAARADTA